MSKPVVGIVMGSDSDLEIMSEAAKILDEFKVPYEISVVSAHRTPEHMYNYAKRASKKGLKILIAGAGGSAHLPGISASLTTLPVIGVPIKTKTMDGIDSLLSIVQMPPGIPVATVAVNGGKNAGLLAVKILATRNNELVRKLSKYATELKKVVMEKSDRLKRSGYKKYLKIK